MRAAGFASGALALAMLAGAACGRHQAAGPAADPAAAAETVRATETAFAKTMADRDHAAFVTFLSDEAVFLSDRRALRGRDAVATAWKPLFDGPDAPFSWSPERVEVLDSGRLALSTGPVLDPGGKRIGTYVSTWRLDPDGRWRIVFDGGCPGCE